MIINQMQMLPLRAPQLMMPIPAPMPKKPGGDGGVLGQILNRALPNGAAPAATPQTAAAATGGGGGGGIMDLIMAAIKSGMVGA